MFEALPGLPLHPLTTDHAQKIIGGFDNHSHTPKINAITKLIVFKVEEQSAISSVLTVQLACTIMDACGANAGVAAAAVVRGKKQRGGFDERG